MTATFAERIDEIVSVAAPSKTAEASWFAPLQIFLGVTAVFCSTAAILMSLWAFLPALIGWHSTAIVSNSMQPSLERGDVVVFGPATDSALDDGTVIRFFPEGEDQAVVHRIVGADMTAGTYRTQGDANPNLDSSGVAFSAVEGIGTLLIPLVGWPLVWLTSGNYLALAIFTLGAITVLWLAHGVFLTAIRGSSAPGLGPLSAHVFSDRADGKLLIPRDLFGSAEIGVWEANHVTQPVAHQH